jgi:hypothetical protein
MVCADSTSKARCLRFGLRLRATGGERGRGAASHPAGMLRDCAASPFPEGECGAAPTVECSASTASKKFQIPRFFSALFAPFALMFFRLRESHVTPGHRRMFLKSRDTCRCEAIRAEAAPMQARRLLRFWSRHLHCTECSAVQVYGRCGGCVGRFCRTLAPAASAGVETPQRPPRPSARRKPNNLFVHPASHRPQAFLKDAAGMKRTTFSGKFGVLTPTKTDEGHHGV